MVAPLLGAQTTLRPLPRDTASRADRVERDLEPSVWVRGRARLGVPLSQRMRELGVPAVSVAVIDAGRVAWARAYGLADVATNRPATAATLFQAASMSKPVASVAALQLVAEGRLGLDEDVNARLTSWHLPASPAAHGRPVTLRELLTHTAGLTVHGFGGYATGTAVPTVIEVLDGVAPANSAPVRIDVEPGTQWRYSGGGMTVMQLLLTDVTEQPFPALLRDRVLTRAGMTRSTYEQPLPGTRAGDAATGYRPRGVPVDGRYHTYPEMAAAGLWTTPSDLGRWIVAIQRAAAGAPNALLSRASAAAMLTPGMGGWGLGVQIEGAGDSLRFTHGAANEGFRGQLVGYVTGGRGVVVMTNGDAGGAIAAELSAAVAREYGWPGLAGTEIVPVPLGTAKAAEYVGRYPIPGRPAALTVAGSSGTLWVVMPGGGRYELIPTGPDRFFALGAGGMRFERGPDGTVVAIAAAGQRLAREGAR